MWEPRDLPDHAASPFNKARVARLGTDQTRAVTFGGGQQPATEAERCLLRFRTEVRQRNPQLLRCGLGLLPGSPPEFVRRIATVHDVVARFREWGQVEDGEPDGPPCRRPGSGWRTGCRLSSGRPGRRRDGSGRGSGHVPGCSLNRGVPVRNCVSTLRCCGRVHPFLGPSAPVLGPAHRSFQPGEPGQLDRRAGWSARPGTDLALVGVAHRSAADPATPPAATCGPANRKINAVQALTAESPCGLAPFPCWSLPGPTQVSARSRCRRMLAPMKGAPLPRPCGCPRTCWHDPVPRGGPSPASRSRQADEVAQRGRRARTKSVIPARFDRP